MQNFGEFGFFEGAEKLLEVWFNLGIGSLKSIQRSDWDKILEIVGAKIVAWEKTEVMDSYVLSESSLFVWDDHFIIKTCGVTTLLPAYPEIEKLVHSMFPNSDICRAFYSHKGYLRQEEQKFPHTSIKNEYKYLKKIFPGGRLSTFKTFKDDMSKWIIYSYFNQECLNKELNISHKDTVRVELMMYGLDETRFKLFRMDSYENAEKEMKMVSNIDKIIPDAVISDKVFDPFGYSANGTKNDIYFTIHVTPQPECSYASFEINQNSPDLTNSCLSCLEIFKPKNFCLAIVCNENATEYPSMLIHKLKSIVACKKVSTYTNNNYCIYYAWF